MMDSFVVPLPDDSLKFKVNNVRKAFLKTSQIANKDRAKALNLMADALHNNMEKILEANKLDYQLAQKKAISNALLSRLRLSKDKLLEGIQGIREVSRLNDPVGQLQIHRELADNLILQRKTVPIGVIGVIFESRPDAVMQISALAIRSGNCVILKGGSESNLTNTEICEALKEGLRLSTIDENSICLLTNRKDSMAMLNLEKEINLIIPRGSNELVKFIQENTKIPVLGHADGICHLYIDRDSDIEMAIKVALDSKIQYPAACNAIETLLIHKDVANEFLTKATPLFKENNVQLRGDEKARCFVEIAPAISDDWATEYLDLILSIKIVEDIDEAIRHIEVYGSRHTDGIISNDINNANKFMNSVGSAGVFHNCSTRFADGFRYGFGAEVGISTQAMPPRGPVGLEGLVTYKYFLKGEGQIVEEFASGAKEFKHENIIK